MKYLFVFLFLPIFINAQQKPFTVFFESNKYEIYQATKFRLQETLQSIKPDSIVIEGYCDSIGDIAYNKILSNKRADAVKKIIIQFGLPKENIRQCIGFGKTKPINANRTEEERQQNRRVVVYFNAIGFDNKEIITDKKNKIETKKTIENILPSKIAKGEKLNLQGIQFYGAHHQVMEESLPILNKLVQILQQNPSLQIDIQGHVCCASGEILDGDDVETGTHDLSIRRARFIYEYLINKGIAAKRLSYQGFGGSRKIYPDERNDFEKQANRRVEFVIVKE